MFILTCVYYLGNQNTGRAGAESFKINFPISLQHFSVKKLIFKF